MAPADDRATRPLLHHILQALPVPRQGTASTTDSEVLLGGETIAAIILMPVVLHGLYGLYDTLLKRGMDLGAGAAVASFAWLAWQVESQRRREEQIVAQAAAAA